MAEMEDSTWHRLSLPLLPLTLGGGGAVSPQPITCSCES